MTFERFSELFNELDFRDKLSIYNDYCLEYRSGDDMIYDFDEEFFETSFSSPVDAARAVYFGSINSWSDEYIRFNRYGNLESLSEYDVESMFEDEIKYIFEHCDVWENYIEFEDDDEEYDEDE